MPNPSSSTRNSATAPISRTVTRMRLSAGVCFSALPTKFSTICVMRTGSASIHTGSSASSMRPSANPRAATSASTQRRTARSSSSACLCRLSLFAVIRPMSSKSSMSRARCCVWRRMLATSGAPPSACLPVSSTAAAVLIAASGLRSSWLRTARNSSLARDAASASARAARSRSSNARRSTVNAAIGSAVIAITMRNACSTSSDSFGRRIANGPRPVAVAAVATIASNAMAVAISRGPNRNAPQTSGARHRNGNGYAPARDERTSRRRRDDRCEQQRCSLHLSRRPTPRRFVHHRTATAR